MVLRVTEKMCVAKIPLNFSHHIDGLEFFWGLEWYGIIASDLLSLRPMLTRQLLYNYKELPKSFYVFFPFELVNSVLFRELKRKGFNIVDSYLFAYNSESYKSQVNARGEVIVFETDNKKKYIQCDSGATKTHHPFTYAFDNRPRNYVHQQSDEEVFSGNYLIESLWKNIERKFYRLVNGVAAVFDNHSGSLGLIKSRGNNDLLSEIHFPGIIGGSFDDVFNQIEWLKYIVTSDKTKTTLEKEKLLAGLDSMQKYKITEYDKNQFFTFTEIEQIENAIRMLAWYLENTDEFNDKSISQAVDKLNQSFHLHNKSIKCNKHFFKQMYDSELMNYFFSGLNGDRPISQFLNFYNILERELNIESKCELQGIKNSLESKDLFPDKLLKSFNDIASECSCIETKEEIFGKKHGWNRHKIAEIIYDKYRNRIVHSKNIKENSPIKPYIDEDNELLFWGCYIREVARYLIKRKSV